MTHQLDLGVNNTSTQCLHVHISTKNQCLHVHISTKNKQNVRILNMNVFVAETSEEQHVKWPNPCYGLWSWKNDLTL